MNAEGFDLRGRTPPGYIAVEGPIGVGKTTLARRLAALFGYPLLVEDAHENPFLERFYRNRREAALATQLFFLFQRARQMQELRQSDLFEPVRVADFLMEKDKLFARQNLDPDEYRIYEDVYAHLTIDAPVPDLVIYLQAPVEVLMQRIQTRGIPAEQLIEEQYLLNLISAYTEFFHYYDRSTLLMVNCADMDYVNNDADYEMLLGFITTLPKGSRHYFNPRPALI